MSRFFARKINLYTKDKAIEVVVSTLIVPNSGKDSVLDGKAVGGFW
jgi:hypothetical protein